MGRVVLSVSQLNNSTNWYYENTENFARITFFQERCLNYVFRYAIARDPCSLNETLSSNGKASKPIDDPRFRRSYKVTKICSNSSHELGTRVR